MKKVMLSLFTILTLTLLSSTVSAQKLITSKTHFKFFSSTPAEDIEAHNYKTVGTLDPKTGAVVFSVPMQSFEFKKALMQEHFNSDKFLDTKKYPKAKFVGTIVDLSQVDFKKDGVYVVSVYGNLTIKGISQVVKTPSTLTIKNHQISLYSNFNVTLADFKIAFKRGKPATHIAKTIAVTAEAIF